MTNKVITTILKPKNLFLITIALIITGVVAACNLNNLALSSLSTIKSITGNKVDLGKIDYSNSTKVDNSDWNQLLSKYVMENGDVNYQGFLGERKLLDKYLVQISNNPPSKNASINEQMAYWINAYNAFTIKLIIDNLPLKSIKDIAGKIPMIDSPWDIKFFSIGGEKFDLNTIEHEILRKNFNDPRIHFAINCASFSCPKLRNEAYESHKLNAQLEDQTSAFINNSEKNKFSSDRISISKLFDWFKSDFSKSGNIRDFISKYSKVKLNPNSKITFLDYDWSLNKVKP